MTTALAENDVGVGRDNHRGPWMQTWLGGRFHFADPSSIEIDHRDIAHALARLSRFTGHTTVPYSVAQHCVLTATMALQETGNRQLAKMMLMHDAAEAYLGDISRPLKSLLPDYQAIETHVWEVIAKRFSLPADMPKAVAEYDNKALAIEKKALLPHSGPWPGLDEVELACEFPVYTFFIAEAQWLRWFKELFPDDPAFKPAS
jgi:uncharacterized protein